MGYYKQAGELVPGDIFIERRYGGTQTYWVVTTRPGFAATIIEVHVDRLGSAHRRRKVICFFRGNRVEMTGADDVAAD